MGLKKVLKYTGKNICITLKDKSGTEYIIDTTIRHEFSYGIYDVVRINTPKRYFETIGNMEYFNAPPLQYLKVSNIEIQGVNFKDKDFGWLTIEDLALKINIDRKYTTPVIDILMKQRPDGATSILYVSGDQISRLALHSIMINL